MDFKVLTQQMDLEKNCTLMLIYFSYAVKNKEEKREISLCCYEKQIILTLGGHQQTSLGSK